MSLKDAKSSTEGITQTSVNYLHKRKNEYLCDLLNENTFVEFLFSLTLTSLPHCVSLLSGFF